MTKVMVPPAADAWRLPARARSGLALRRRGGGSGLRARWSGWQGPGWRHATGSDEGHRARPNRLVRKSGGRHRLHSLAFIAEAMWATLWRRRRFCRIELDRPFVNKNLRAVAARRFPLAPMLPRGIGRRGRSATMTRESVALRGERCARGIARRRGSSRVARYAANESDCVIDPRVRPPMTSERSDRVSRKQALGNDAVMLLDRAGAACCFTRPRCPVCVWHWDLGPARLRFFCPAFLWPRRRQSLWQVLPLGPTGFGTRPTPAVGVCRQSILIAPEPWCAGIYWSKLTWPSSPTAS